MLFLVQPVNLFIIFIKIGWLIVKIIRKILKLSKPGGSGKIFYI
jgi:hypothetical protein